MPQPVSFCTACLLPRLALLTLRSWLRGSPCWALECAGTRIVMTHKIDCEARDEGVTEETQILFTLDLAGDFKFVNSAAAELFGYPAAEICVMNIADLVAPGFSHYLQGQMARAIAGELGAVYEVEIYTKDGQCLPLEISTRLVIRNGSPFELEGIAFPLINTFGGRPRCLDEEFWIGPGLNGPMALTFIPTR